MILQKFSNEAFGTLTTVKSENTGVVMFIGKEVADVWGHTNLTQAIKASKLSENEYKVIRMSKFPDFKKQLTNLKLVGERTASVTFLTESGVYKMALASNLNKAKDFRNWIASEVLPSIRKYGYYAFADHTEKIMMHTNRAIQIDNSKGINKKHIIENGVESTINYNRESCLLHTGKSPSEVKRLGKEAGLKSKHTGSAKEVLRQIDPARAAAMSFTDRLVMDGFDLKTVSELSLRAALPLFEGMIELGMLDAK